MRRSLLGAALLAALLAVSPDARAQLLPSFGVTGGLNFTSLSDAATFDTDNSTGFHVGLFADAGFGPIGARAAVLYVSAGSVEEAVAGAALRRRNVAYIALPVDLQYRMMTPLVRPYALFGPEARFAVGDLASSDARSVAVALNFGVGAELSAFIGPKVFGEIRYGLDVTGFFDDEVFGTPATQNESLKVNMVALRVGIGL
jgi:hypothetical protein